MSCQLPHMVANVAELLDVEDEEVLVYQLVTLRDFQQQQLNAETRR